MDKQDIIREIKRTAEENGGTPLGSRKFASETGIGDREWRGRYWVRWSEAVGEAGFAPNQQTTAYNVELIHTIPTEAPEAAERYWHERFNAKRKGGEWFDLNAADVKTFRRCKSM